MRIEGFTDLIVWRRAHEVTLAIYEITTNFPDTEKFGMISQLRRSASSVAANIAEGYKKGTKEFLKFLMIAEGSLEETKYHLILCRDLGYCDEDNYNHVFDKCNEVGRMLHSLRSKLK